MRIQQNSLDIDHAKAMQMGNVQRYADTIAQLTQNAVDSEITNILNKLSLLSSDVKGSTVDSQI